MESGETRCSVAVTVELFVDSVGVKKDMPPDENLCFLGRRNMNV